MNSEIAALISATWTTEVIKNETSFGAAMARIGDTLTACRRQGDIKTANSWLACLIEARHLVSKPSFAAIYAHWLALASATMADWLVCQHQFKQAVVVATSAWDTLNEKDARRAALGLRPALSPESRWRLLGVLANVQWRMPEGEFRNVVFTPPQYVKAWIRFAQEMQTDMTARTPLADSPMLGRQQHHQLDRQKTESLLWAGLWTACCAYRYCRSELLPLVREFNILHRRHYRCAGMALAEGHWQEGLPLAPESPLYWHFEIAKQWLNAERPARGKERGSRPGLALEQLEELYSRLMDSAEIWTSGRPDGVYTGGLQLDYRWMRDALGAPVKLAVRPLVAVSNFVLPLTAVAA